jgi:hypothetical protein
MRRLRGMRSFVTAGLVLWLSLVIPSCGFITGLFDEDGDGDVPSVYTVSMAYDATGLGISSSRPLIFVFFPLYDGEKITDESFDAAAAAPAFIERGFVTLELQEGPYTVVAFVDGSNYGEPNGELDPGEQYEFLDDRDVVKGLRYPTAYYVDASIEGSMPIFVVEAPYSMPDIVVLFPEDGETLSGANEEWGVGFIASFGFTVNKSLDYVAAYVDDSWRVNGLIGEDHSYEVMIDMGPYPSHTYVLEIRGYSGSMPVDEPSDYEKVSTSVSFSYLAP